MTQPAPRFFAYLRVSADKQGRSDLGLEAQRTAIATHVDGARGRIVAEHVEVESGRKKDRLQLAAALEACRAMRGILVMGNGDDPGQNLTHLGRDTVLVT